MFLTNLSGGVESRHAESSMGGGRGSRPRIITDPSRGWVDNDLGSGSSVPPAQNFNNRKEGDATCTNAHAQSAVNTERTNDSAPRLVSDAAPSVRSALVAADEKSHRSGNRSKSSSGSGYPNKPGFKASGTSSAAAQIADKDAHKVRQECLDLLRHGEHTSDEIAAILKRSVLYVRPRLSELVAQGKVVKTDKRRPSCTGMSATVWRAI